MWHQPELFRKNLPQLDRSLPTGISYELPHGKGYGIIKADFLSIADVGSAVGYENQLHFSRAFKNIYGVSPREWRKQNK